MSTLIYVDTNIYLDFLLDRHNEYGKYLGDDAFSIFNRAVHCEFTIVISYTVLDGLFRNYPSEKTMLLFAFLKKKLVKVIASNEEIAIWRKRCTCHIMMLSTHYLRRSIKHNTS